jgi:hypothetical protein
VPGVLVVSTDRPLRWIRWTLEKEYAAALDPLLPKDPAVVARRKAERDNIENKR